MMPRWCEPDEDEQEERRARARARHAAKHKPKQHVFEPYDDDEDHYR